MDSNAKNTHSFMNKKKGEVHMLEYEKIFLEALHAELKKKIIGGIHVCISEDDELCVRIIRSKDRNYIYTYLSNENFSNMIIRGYSVKDAACDILEAYHEYVRNMCFK